MPNVCKYIEAIVYKSIPLSLWVGFLYPSAGAGSSLCSILFMIIYLIQRVYMIKLTQKEIIKNR